MVHVAVEGVRRNFTTSSVFMYSVTLAQVDRQRLFVFGAERHEALAVLGAQHHLSLPRPPGMYVLSQALTLANTTLESVTIEQFSMLPPRYNLCSTVMHWHQGEATHDQHLEGSPGDVVAIALLMHAPILLADDLADRIGINLAECETAEILFARQVLRQEGITISTESNLRLGYSKTPLRDALVKEFKAALSGKAPPFPEEHMQELKASYIDSLLGTKT